MRRFTATIAGTVLPKGSMFLAGNTAYQSTAAVTLGVGQNVVSLVALDAGAVGNLAAGAALSLVVAVVGVSGAAGIAVQSMTGGADEESDDELRVRVLARIRQPPMGGCATDWVSWALDVAGVTRAWVSPLEMGTASILQPLIGLYTDQRPQPYSLPVAMLASMAGLLTLAFAPNYHVLLVGAAFLGLGSSIFHPESSRIARLSSGGRHGLAQSVFQVGGNFGTALGPLLAAYVIFPRGQSGLAWFAFAALVGTIVMSWLSHWYRSNGHARRPAQRTATRHPSVSPGGVRLAMAVLVTLLFSKYVYLASITNFYIFYMMQRFGLSTQSAQICQFVFFAAVAAATIVGGPVGDRVGRKVVIWASILGVLPFTLALPYVGLVPTIVLSVIIGFVIASAFPAIVVYGQELVPGRTGMVFGLIFGVGGISAALLGTLADHAGIVFVYRACAFLPAIGLLTAFLPNIESTAHGTEK